MPNGVTKSQKTQHANNQRVKMEAKHTEQMDTLRKQFQSKVADLDDKNKTLTLQIAQATKKIPTTKEDTNEETKEQVVKLRLRLKEVRSKEREVANQLLAEVAKNHDLQQKCDIAVERRRDAQQKCDIAVNSFCHQEDTDRDDMLALKRYREAMDEIDALVPALKDEDGGTIEGIVDYIKTSICRDTKFRCDTLLIAKQARRIAELEAEFLGDIVD